MTQMKQLRDAAGLSRERVAATLGVSLGTIRNWETGAAEPSARKAAELAECYGVSVEAVIEAIRETWRQQNACPSL